MRIANSSFLFPALFATTALCSASLLTGCAGGNVATTEAAPAAATRVAISGVVHGGQNPVGGSVVQLWETGTTGYGTGSSQLIASTTTAAGSGSFSFPTSNVPGNCASGPYTYITATGGDATGQTANNVNPSIELVAVLGACSTTGASTQVILSEVTTVAAAYALSNFASDSSGTVSVGAPVSNAQGLSDAIANATLLANSSSGAANNSTSSMLLPTALLNTLANTIAACINSSSTTSNGTTTPSSTCASLFSYTIPPGSSTTAPTDTFQAAVNMAKYPGNNAVNLLLLGSSTPPFAPALSASAATNTTSANDLTLAIGFQNSTLNTAYTTGIGLAIDSTDNVILGGSLSNSASPYTSEYLAIVKSASAGATETVSTLPSSISAATPQNAAVDASNTIWLADSSGADVIKIPNETASSATQILLTSPDGVTPSITGTANTATLADNTYGIAIDGSNNIWTSSYRSQGNCSTTPSTTTTANSICELQELPTGTGTTFSYKFGSSNTQGYDYTERNLTIDSSTSASDGNANNTGGNIWLPNYGGATGASTGQGVVEIFTPGSSSVAATTVNVTVSNSSTNAYGSGPYAVALDGSGNGWVTTNYAGTGANAQYLFQVPYNATSATTPTAAVGFSPAGISSTGSAPATTSSPAAATAYTVGGLNAPRNVAIDGAGNIFVANYGPKALVEYSPSFAHGSTTGAYLSPYYGFAPSLAGPVFVSSYYISAANLVTFNTPNNLVAGQSVKLAGFTNASGTYMNGQTVSVTTASAYLFTATPTGGAGTAAGTKAAPLSDPGTATPASLNPVTFTCTNAGSTNTCTLPGAFTILGSVAIDKAGSIWTVGSNGTLIEILGTAAPTDPLLSDGRYGSKP